VQLTLEAAFYVACFLKLMPFLFRTESHATVKSRTRISGGNCTPCPAPVDVRQADNIIAGASCIRCQPNMDKTMNHSITGFNTPRSLQALQQCAERKHQPMPFNEAFRGFQHFAPALVAYCCTGTPHHQAPTSAPLGGSAPTGARQIVMHSMLR
jgi:hypothetical protein